MLPQLAEGDANKVFVVPSEFAQAFGGIGEALRGRSATARRRRPARPAIRTCLPHAGPPRRRATTPAARRRIVS